MAKPGVKHLKIPFFLFPSIYNYKIKKRTQHKQHFYPIILLIKLIHFSQTLNKKVQKMQQQTTNTITILKPPSQLNLPYPFTILSFQTTPSGLISTTIKIKTPHKLINNNTNLYPILNKPNKNTPFYHFTNSHNNKSKSFQLSYHSL